MRDTKNLRKKRKRKKKITRSRRKMRPSSPMPKNFFREFFFSRNSRQQLFKSAPLASLAPHYFFFSEKSKQIHTLGVKIYTIYQYNRPTFLSPVLAKNLPGYLYLSICFRDMGPPNRLNSNCWCGDPSGEKAEVMCSSCERWVHYYCLGVTMRQLYNLVEEEKSLYLCKCCTSDADAATIAQSLVTANPSNTLFKFDAHLFCPETQNRSPVESPELQSIHQKL